MSTGGARGGWWPAAAAAAALAVPVAAWGVRRLLRARSTSPASAAAPAAATAREVAAAAARFAPVDGLRAISSLSLVALHTAMLSTSFVAPGTAAWARLTQHPLFGVALGGGLQTDVFLLLSGFLQGARLRRSGGGGFVGVAEGVARRALRLWPALIVQMALGLGLLGEPRGRPEWLAVTVATVLTFSNNYADVARHGTLASTPGWSVCVDVQCGGALAAAHAALRSAAPSAAAADAATRVGLGAALAASLALRAAAFVRDARGMSVVRQPLHFGQIQTGGSAAWFEAHFPPFKWPLPRGAAFGVPGVPGCTEAAGAFAYLRSLYFPTHARFGPFVLGALIGMSLPPAADGEPGERELPSPPRARLHAAPLCALTAASLATLGASMLPPPLEPDALPPAAHAVATVAGPTLGAAAVGFLLFTAVVPRRSRWHNAPLRRALSWRGWRPLAARSYELNMLHFRIVLGLAFSWLGRARAAGAEVTWARVGALYAAGLGASLAAAAAATAAAPALRRALACALGWTALLPGAPGRGARKQEL